MFSLPSFQSLRCSATCPEGFDLLFARAVSFFHIDNLHIALFDLYFSHNCQFLLKLSFLMLLSHYRNFTRVTPQNRCPYYFLYASLLSTLLPSQLVYVSCRGKKPMKLQVWCWLVMSKGRWQF